MPAPGLPALRPDWPAPARVRALFTLRGASAAHGASAPPWQHFNLGDHVGDNPAAVAANRQRLADATGAQPIFLNQVHGRAVARLAPGAAHGACADAACTTQPGLACTVLVADCLPVLLTDTQGRAVAAAHAGWRGLATGVLAATVAQLCAQTPGLQAHQLLAWLGPCIGPQAFEVGPDVHAAFTATDPGAATCFTPAPGGKWRANLPALARRQLTALGLPPAWGNDGSPAWCTVSQPARYFSYRRDQARLGATGRMAACIWLA